MIAFDLECSNGHTFEGWFADSRAFEKQLAGGLVSCPTCNDTDVHRILSPVAIRSSNRPSEERKTTIDYQRLAREVVHYIDRNFENMGTDFAKEALKIHYGVADKRNIRGVATDAEEKTLKEEGVEFFKLPGVRETEDDDTE